MLHTWHTACLHPGWLVHCSACPYTPLVDSSHIAQLTVHMVHCMVHTLRLGSHGALAQSDSFYHCIMYTLDRSIPVLPKFPCSHKKITNLDIETHESNQIFSISPRPGELGQTYMLNGMTVIKLYDMSHLARSKGGKSAQCTHCALMVQNWNTVSVPKHLAKVC